MKNTLILDIWAHARLIPGVVWVFMDSTSPMQRHEGLLSKKITIIGIEYVHIFFHHSDSVTNWHYFGAQYSSDLILALVWRMQGKCSTTTVHNQCTRPYGTHWAHWAHLYPMH